MPQFTDDVIECCVVLSVPKVDLGPSMKEPMKHARLAPMNGSTNQSMLTININTVDGSEAMLKQILDVLDRPGIVHQAETVLALIVEYEVSRATLG